MKIMFFHEYTDVDKYKIRGSDGRDTWSDKHPLYIEFCKENVPQKISGDEFILVASDGTVFIHPDKDKILLERHNEQMKRRREQAFKDECDPLAGKHIRGEVTLDIVIAKAMEIRERFPYME